MKRMNKVLVKAVVLSLIMGGVHMGGDFCLKGYAAAIGTGLEIHAGLDVMNNADVKADKDAIKDAGALATQKDLEAVNRDAETAKETAEAAEREAADAHSKATGAYLEAQEAQEKNTEQDKTLSEQGQKISENSTAIEQNTADIETNKQGIATNKENIEKNTQAITTERTERIQEVQRLDGRIDGLSNRIDELDGRIDKVGALAVAMAGLHPLEYDPDAPTQFSMAAGTYSGESAIAAGLFHNPNKDVLLSVGFSISGSEKAANVGATFRFGRSSESKARKVIEDKQREQELAAQAAAARQKTVSYRVEQILAEDTAKAE